MKNPIAADPDLSPFMQDFILSLSKLSPMPNNPNKLSIFWQELKRRNEITHNFRLVRIEKEVENLFYREALKSSASGLMAVAENGDISLINDAALQILGMESLNSLSELGKLHPGLEELVTSGDLNHHQVKLSVNRRMLQLAVKATEIQLEGKPVRIYSV
ncbi:MAG: PAS domain-containing protein, partial [Bacteroidia bacterium]